MSNSMIACPKCRVGRKGRGATNCHRCGTPELDFSYRITLPKKNNDKAWELISAGYIFWDTKKTGGEPRKSRNRLTSERIQLERAKRLREQWS